MEQKDFEIIIIWVFPFSGFRYESRTSTQHITRYDYAYTDVTVISTHPSAISVKQKTIFVTAITIIVVINIVLIICAIIRVMVVCKPQGKCGVTVVKAMSNLKAKVQTCCKLQSDTASAISTSTTLNVFGQAGSTDISEDNKLISGEPSCDPEQVRHFTISNHQ